MSGALGALREAVAEQLRESGVNAVAAMEPDRARITELALLPAWQGRRYGVQLLGQAVRLARAGGRETLALTCPPALAGYFAKYGFVPEGGEMVMDLRRRVGEIPEV